MAAWLTNKGKYNLTLGRLSTFKIGLCVAFTASANTQALVADFNTVTDLLVTAACTECTLAGYARQALTSTTRTEDDTNDRVNFDAADIAWGTLPAGQTIYGAFIYDATVDTNDTTRELISVDWFTTPFTTNATTLTYAITDFIRLS